jgi:pimeloyl-ACP methyl ester carboxylesterase
MLSEKYHFVVMSFSGMGGSDWRSFYTRDTFVDDVWGVVKDTGMEDPIVVGHSFGGMVSLITASKHSEDMSGLLLVDFVVNKPEEHHEWYEGRAPARPPRIVKEREELIKRFRLMPPQQCINQYLVNYIADHSIRETEKGWAWTFDPSAYDGLIIGSDHSKILSELSCPVGFYYGEHTIEFKEGELQTMKDLLPEDSPIFGLKDAQHHLMLDQPLLFIENLDRLIQELLTKSS